MNQNQLKKFDEEEWRYLIKAYGWGASACKKDFIKLIVKRFYNLDV